MDRNLANTSLARDNSDFEDDQQQTKKHSESFLGLIQALNGQPGKEERESEHFVQRQLECQQVNLSTGASTAGNYDKYIQIEADVNPENLSPLNLHQKPMHNEMPLTYDPDQYYQPQAGPHNGDRFIPQRQAFQREDAREALVHLLNDSSSLASSCLNAAADMSKHSSNANNVSTKELQLKQQKEHKHALMGSALMPNFTAPAFTRQTNGEKGILSAQNNNFHANSKFGPDFNGIKQQTTTGSNMVVNLGGNARDQENDRPRERLPTNFNFEDDNAQDRLKTTFLPSRFLNFECKGGASNNVNGCGLDTSADYIDMLTVTKHSKSRQKRLANQYQQIELDGGRHQENNSHMLTTADLDLQPKISLRKRDFILSSKPVKILAAPGIQIPCNQSSHLMDWQGQNKNSVFAIGLKNAVYLQQDILQPSSSLSVIQTAQNQTIVSLKLDKTAEGLLLGLPEGKVQVYDTRNSSQIRELNSHQQKITCMDWHQDQPWLIAAGSRDQSISLHDLRVRQSLINTLKGHEGSLTKLKFISENSLVATSHQDNCLAVWKEVQDQQKANAQFKIHEEPVTAFDYHKSDGLLAFACNNTLSIYKDLTTDDFEVVHSMKFNSQCTSLLWKPHGCHELLTMHGQPNNELKMWQVDKLNNAGVDKRQRNQFQYWFSKVKTFQDCHDAPCQESRISPNGQYVATLSSDETICLWHLFEAQQSQSGKKLVQQIKTKDLPLR